ERDARVGAQIEPAQLQIDAEIDGAPAGVEDAALERVREARLRLERDLRAIGEEEADRHAGEARPQIELGADAEDDVAAVDAGRVAKVAAPQILRRAEEPDHRMRRIGDGGARLHRVRIDALADRAVVDLPDGEA